MIVEKTNNSRRILMIIPSMVGGGAERVFAILANELSKNGFQVKILTLTSNKIFYSLDSNIKIASAGFKINKKNKIIRIIDMLVSGIKGISFIKRHIKKWKPNLVLSFLTHTNILSIIVHSFYRDLPFIISERNDPTRRNILIQVIIKYIYSKADCLVCQSETVAQYFPKRLQKRIKVIPNPIHEESFDKQIPNQRRKTIVGVGRLFPQKNFSLLINSFNDIKNEFPDYTLEIYGDGYLRDKLQYQINELKLNDRVFLMGIKKDVMKHVFDAELFVMSSNFEGFPNALIEAMASGLPVISTNFSTGVAEDLIKEENGIVVPVGDQKALSNAMRKILSDENLRRRMSVHNRKIINILSKEKIISNWLQLFEEVSNQNIN